LFFFCCFIVFIRLENKRSCARYGFFTCSNWFLCWLLTEDGGGTEGCTSFACPGLTWRIQMTAKDYNTFNVDNNDQVLNVPLLCSRLPTISSDALRNPGSWCLTAVSDRCCMKPWHHLVTVMLDEQSLEPEKTKWWLSMTGLERVQWLIQVKTYSWKRSMISTAEHSWNSGWSFLRLTSYPLHHKTWIVVSRMFVFI